MKFALFLFFLGLFAFAYGDDCLKPCPALHKPVCAVRGNEHKTFATECVLNAHNCRTKEACATYVTAEECPTVCTFLYKPICATDGSSSQTYPNECAFNIEVCKGPKKGWTIKDKNGACP